MVNAVIFDMDGLMFDTERVYAKAWEYGCEKIGYPEGATISLKIMGMNMTTSRKILIEEMGDYYDEEKIRKYNREYLDHYYEEHHVPIKKGLFELLDYLKAHHYKIGLASSTAEPTVRAHLKDAGIEDRFSVILCGDMVEFSKPYPDIYLKAAAALGEKPENCIALEDSKNGLTAAYRAGCQAVMIPDLWQPDEEIEKILTAKFDSLDQVIPYLEKQSNGAR